VQLSTAEVPYSQRYPDTSDIELRQHVKVPAPGLALTLNLMVHHFLTTNLSLFVHHRCNYNMTSTLCMPPFVFICNVVGAADEVLGHVVNEVVVEDGCLPPAQERNRRAVVDERLLSHGGLATGGGAEAIASFKYLKPPSILRWKQALL
jgi:hypothetical protein